MFTPCFIKKNTQNIKNSFFGFAFLVFTDQGTDAEGENVCAATSAQETSNRGGQITWAGPAGELTYWPADLTFTCASLSESPSADSDAEAVPQSHRLLRATEKSSPESSATVETSGKTGQFVRHLRHWNNLTVGALLQVIEMPKMAV